MKLTDATPGRLALGLAVGLLVAVAAGQAYVSRVVASFGDAAAERSALVSLGALTHMVEARGLDDEGLQEAVAGYDAANEAVSSIRVIRFQGIRLVASTVPEDAGDQAAPRRLAREEKPLYDLGQRLRANVETNVLEGRKWKEEVSVEPLGGSSEEEGEEGGEGDEADAEPTVPDGASTPSPETSISETSISKDQGALALAAPVAEGDEIVGAVLMEARPEPADIRGSGFGVSTLALILLPVILMLVAGRFLHDPRALVAVAAVLLVGALLVFMSTSAERLLDGRRAVETAMSERLTEEAARIGTSAEGVDITAWDMDLLRSPLGFQNAAGVDESRLVSELAEQGASLRKLTAFSGLAALLLAAFVGLGGAVRLAHILSTHRNAYYYVLPAMVVMLLLVFLPFFYGILLSFTNQSIYNTDKGLGEIWVGLQNFKEILSDFEVFRETDQGREVNYQNFYWTLGFTVIWTVVNVFFGVTIGLGLAIILNAKGFAFRGIYRVILILPWAMPNYITSLIWKGMFHSQFGVINQVIQMFGGSAISWFDTPFTSFVTVLSTNAWLSFPFMMVMSLGALQSIPSDLYEAARVDGASRFQQFRSITLPSLKPALVPAVIISVVWTFNMFNIIYLVAEGEPGGSTEILITEAYKIAFEQYRYGYAAAYSVLIFVILLAYGVWQNHVTSATEGV